jgi:hypothetical protein
MRIFEFTRPPDRPVDWPAFCAFVDVAINLMRLTFDDQIDAKQFVRDN